MTAAAHLLDVAARGFVDVVRAVPDAGWERPALGVWSVRDLVGHASRALWTIGAYLEHPVDASAPRVVDAVAYYEAVGAGLADPDAVARRGREAGAALGPSPATAVAELADRILPLVEVTPGTTDVATPVGVMALDAYLPTRTFEVVVHTLDLARAVEVDVPATLDEPVAACLDLAGSLAARRGRGPALLLALTGRAPLPAGFTVL